MEVDEPMQVGVMSTQRRRDFRKKNVLCFYCGNSGHFIRFCPTRPPAKTHQHLSDFRGHSGAKVFPEPQRRSPARVSLTENKVPDMATVDSVAKDTKSLSIGVCELSSSEPVTNVTPDNHLVSNPESDIFTVICSLQCSAPGNTPADKLFVPSDHRAKVMEECHGTGLAEHSGATATMQMVSESYWWPKWSQDVKKFVADCDVCTRTMVPGRRPAEPPCPLSVPSKPWTHLAMYFITGLPSSQGMTVLWVVADRFSKMCHLFPLEKIPNPKEFATMFVDNILKLHGVPEDIVFDHGEQLLSVSFWREFCKKLGIHQSVLSSCPTESNEQSEQASLIVERFIRIFVSEGQEEWARHLALAEFVYNHHTLPSSDMSPFLRSYGFEPRFSCLSSDPSSNPQADAVVSNLCTGWIQARRSLLSALGTNI